jgi:hypothetical protein
MFSGEQDDEDEEAERASQDAFFDPNSWQKIVGPTNIQTGHHDQNQFMRQGAQRISFIQKKLDRDAHRKSNILKQIEKAKAQQEVRQRLKVLKSKNDMN